MTWDKTGSQAGLMHIVCAMVSQRDKAPTNALVVQAVRSCTERKIPYLVYSNFAYEQAAHLVVMRSQRPSWSHSTGTRRRLSSIKRVASHFRCGGGAGIARSRSL